MGRYSVNKKGCPLAEYKNRFTRAFIGFQKSV
jgi:hypothetical protein